MIRIPKLPQGNRKSPWYYISEKTINNKTIKAYFEHNSKNGVWKMEKLPENCFIKIDTNW